MHYLSKYIISSTGSGYEELTKCTTDAAINSIITHVSNTDDMYGKIQVTKYCTGDSTARDFGIIIRTYGKLRLRKWEKIEENKEENDADKFW